MLLIDTSVWISVFRVGAARRRHRIGQVRPQLETLIADRQIFLTRFTQARLIAVLLKRHWRIIYF